MSVPSPKEQPDGVFRLFGELVGLDGTTLRGTDTPVNTSFGYTEAEVLRRVNVALGKRLPDLERDYTPVVRKVLARGSLGREQSAKITLPPEHLDWVRAEDQARVEELVSSGYHILGDPATLIAPADAARPIPPLDEAEVAQAAVRTLADVAVRTTRLMREAADAASAARAAGTGDDADGADSAADAGAAAASGLRKVRSSLRRAVRARAQSPE